MAPTGVATTTAASIAAATLRTRVRMAPPTANATAADSEGARRLREDARSPGVSTPETNPVLQGSSYRCERATAAGQRADLVAVRRQRVQTSSRVVRPSRVIGKGWRFGW